MKKIFHLIIKSRIVKNIVNPSYNKIGAVSTGSICIILSEENMLGDLVIHNFIVQQLQFHGYSVSYGMSDSFFSRFRFFFENHSMADHLFVLPESKRKWGRFIKDIRKAGINAVILDEYPLVDPVFFYLAGVPVLIGPSQNKSNFYTREYRLEKMYLHYTDIVEPLLNLLANGQVERKQHVISPFFPFEKMDIKELHTGHEVSLSVHIGGGSYWNRKWPKERYLEIGRLFLQHYEGKLLLIGGEDEHAANEEIRKDLIETCNAAGRVINFCGVDLHTTASVISSSKVFIGNDSGPMHIAVALNKRVIGIFGPSAIHVVNPTKYDQRNITIHSDLECVPCNNNHCMLPEGSKFSCLTGLSSSMVWEKLQSVI